MNRGKQTQQMDAKELGGGVFAMPSAGGSVRPALVDEIVGNERGKEFKECSGAGRRKIRIHGHKTTAGSLTRHRECPTPKSTPLPPL